MTMAFATGPYTYVWADALTMKVREGGRRPRTGSEDHDESCRSQLAVELTEVGYTRGF